MRINKVHLEKDLIEMNGIDPIHIERLGAVVALVGRNGSGKTRILNLLEKQVLPQIDVFKILDGTVTHIPNSILNEIKQIEPFKESFLLHFRYPELRELFNKNPKDEKIKAEFTQAKIEYKVAFNTLQARKRAEAFPKLYLDISSKINKIIPRYFRKIKLSDIQQLQQVIEDTKGDPQITFEKLIESVTEQDDYNEFGSIHKTALSYLAKLPHELVDDLDDCYGDQKKFHERQSYKRFFSLKKLVKDFLNKDLEWEKTIVNRKLDAEGVTRQSQGVWKLQGRLFNYADLSDGEKALFAYSLLFFLLEQNPSIRIRESIIIIDEPEQHLHPESELAVIRGVRKVIEDEGQLWIATHSISILSGLSYDEIFMVKDNTIISPGKTVPGKSFIELMGLEDHIVKLTHFIVNISNWAFLNFMTQCFNEPEVIESARPDDPEVELFKQSIANNKNGNVLLDFGAGQGRMINEFTSDEIQKNNIQYYALEPEKKNLEKLNKLNLKGIYRNYSELPEKTFDYILLCNVLHEIPILQWEPVVNKIIVSLKDNGFIILIEDTRLPKGEKIGEVGFLILDIPSIQELFTLEKPPGQLLSSDQRYKDRILCSVIRKQKIHSVDKSTIIRALETLKKSTLSKIKDIRKTVINEENKMAAGRESAFYSQLYINTLLAIDKLNDIDKN